MTALDRSVTTNTTITTNTILLLLLLLLLFNATNTNYYKQRLLSWHKQSLKAMLHQCCCVMCRCRLDNDMQVKVADFGLSRDIYERDYYSSDNRKSKLPVKWMALESLEKGIYNSKTDVVRAVHRLRSLFVSLLFYIWRKLMLCVGGRGPMGHGYISGVHLQNVQIFSVYNFCIKYQYIFTSKGGPPRCRAP